ncbi:MAG TPA: ATP-binding protein [bacterium]|nr:ATP-binding protein [bacterium]HQQ00250.1 ATP-binding protein [bacterium]
MSQVLSYTTAEQKYEISSRLESIYPLEQEILEVICSFGYSDDEVFGIRLAMDEALINAIMHGNHGHEYKRIFVNLQVNSEWVEISVRDEGNGFDLSCLFDPTTEEHLHDPHGRGIFLIREFMSEVTFNEIGNQITFLHRKSEGEPTVV